MGQRYCEDIDGYVVETEIFRAVRLITLHFSKYVCLNSTMLINFKFICVFTFPFLNKHQKVL